MTSGCRHLHAPCVLPCMGQEMSSPLCALCGNNGVCLLVPPAQVMRPTLKPKEESAEYSGGAAGGQGGAY